MSRPTKKSKGIYQPPASIQKSDDERILEMLTKAAQRGLEFAEMDAGVAAQWEEARREWARMQVTNGGPARSLGAYATDEELVAWADDTLGPRSFQSPRLGYSPAPGWVHMIRTNDARQDSNDPLLAMIAHQTETTLAQMAKFEEYLPICWMAFDKNGIYTHFLLEGGPPRPNSYPVVWPPPLSWGGIPVRYVRTLNTQIAFPSGVLYERLPPLRGGTLV